MESQVRGGTRWKRFALVMVPSVAATAAIGIGLAQGALAASFSVSGVDFKVTADRLEGDDLLQYGSIATGTDLEGNKAAHPVVVSGFSHAEIYNMCQSVVTPKVPIFGNITMTINAGGGSEPVKADNIYLDVSQLDTDAEFTNIDIGVAAGQGSANGKTKMQENASPKSNGYGFAQRAEHATLKKVEQRAWATTAGSFKLNGLKLRLSTGANECQLKH